MRIIRAVGGGTMSVVAQLGALNLMMYRIIRSVFPPRFDREELWRQLNKIGVASVPIIVLTSFLVGVIMVLQAMLYVRKTGATSLVGMATGLAVFAELGPALIALMFSGRVGANTTAEFGNMVVSEQVEALKALAIDPIKFMVAPRFLAIVIGLVMLVGVGDLMGILGGMLSAQLVVDIDWRTFLDGMLELDLLDAFIVGHIKGLCFGTVIATCASTYGMGVTGGARGVGRAVNGCVVTTAIGIFISDYLVTYIWLKYF